MFKQRNPVDLNQSAWFSAVERSQLSSIVVSEDDGFHVREVLPASDRQLNTNARFTYNIKPRIDV
jgi:hypothetical protein